ncbi:hypothetical protein ACMYSQ_011852 [Aspergillus niger]
MGVSLYHYTEDESPGGGRNPEQDRGQVIIVNLTADSRGALLGESADLSA